MITIKLNNGLPYPDNMLGFVDNCTKLEFENIHKHNHYPYPVYLKLADTGEEYLYNPKPQQYERLFDGLDDPYISELPSKEEVNMIIKDNYISKKEVPNNSKFVVIDGVDGCGKGTQVKLVQDIFKENTNTCFLSFPNYGNESCTMVEKYLHGEFGYDADTVDPYLAASFYTIDRALSYKDNQHWKDVIQNNGLIIADRYTSANIIHQGSKLPEDKLVDFIRWLYNQEYNISKIPQPDLVIFLNINEKANENLIKDRMKNDPSRADIHEKDFEYIRKCRNTLDLLARNDSEILNPIKEEFPKTKYVFIDVSDENGMMKSRLDIFKDIMWHIAIGG